MSVYRQNANLVIVAIYSKGNCYANSSLYCCSERNEIIKGNLFVKCLCSSFGSTFLDLLLCGSDSSCHC